MSEKLISARIIAAHGRHYIVNCNGQNIQCIRRGKKSDVAVGDYVQITPVSKEQAVIQNIESRHTLLYRSDQYKSKLLAANVDQIFLVIATEPEFSDDLVSRALVAAQAGGMHIDIVLNKIDLPLHRLRAEKRAQFYAELGYCVHLVSVNEQPEETKAKLRPLLKGKTSIFVGQSGMGKSSLLNLLAPEANAQVREISTVLNSGKHTTTFSRLYELEPDTFLIDSPGFQEFGLYHLTEGMLERAFCEFQPYLGKCRFYNCHHLTEPSCAILKAVSEGKISQQRHDLYRQLVHESSQKVYGKT